MRIAIDPMPALRADAVRQVNEFFNQLAARNVHRDQAHAAKRMAAAAGNLTALEAEAELRGITPSELAELILSKPGSASDRELDRQRVLLQIEKVATPLKLKALLSIAIR